MVDRAVLFIDGSNWYHGLCHNLGLPNLRRLDYAAISEKLVGPRTWIGTRYYVGQVQQGSSPRLYANQRRFLAHLTATDHRISYQLGRLESRRAPNKVARELREYLDDLTVPIHAKVLRDLRQLARTHERTHIVVEKAVDVRLAVDLVLMAGRNEYDAAYLLSADGDFTPAVEAARSMGKKVYAVSPLFSTQLAAAATAFIRLDRAWFCDCYVRESSGSRLADDSASLRRCGSRDDLFPISPRKVKSSRPLAVTRLSAYAKGRCSSIPVRVKTWCASAEAPPTPKVALPSRHWS